MNITIPDDIADDFMNLLDVAQCSVHADDLKRLTDSERKCLEFVEQLLGDRASKRFDSVQQARDAATMLVNIFNP